MRLGADLVLALVDVAVALGVAVFGALGVELDFDVGLEALCGLFAGGEGDVLGGEEGEYQGGGFAGDGDGAGGVFCCGWFGAISCRRKPLVEELCLFYTTQYGWL